MAGVICEVCGTENTDGEALCRDCGVLLAESGGREEEVRPPFEETVAAATCPACGAPVPDPANLVCVDCLEPLTPQEPAPSALRLLFAGRPVEVPQAGSVLLGRDPDHSPVADLFTAHDNVSRRHASVGVDADGRAWVRDEHSTNGTFVNDKPVPGGQKATLAPGDRLRMASDVVAQVQADAGRPA